MLYTGCGDDRLFALGFLVLSGYLRWWSPNTMVNECIISVQCSDTEYGQSCALRY